MCQKIINSLIHVTCIIQFIPLKHVNSVYKKGITHIVQKMATVSLLMAMTWRKKKRSSKCMWLLVFQLLLKNGNNFVYNMSERMFRKTTIWARTWAGGVKRLQCAELWSLWAMSLVVPGGLSCQVDQVVKGWSDNTGWQTERSRAGQPQSCLHGGFRTSTNKIPRIHHWMNMSRWIHTNSSLVLLLILNLNCILRPVILQLYTIIPHHSTITRIWCTDIHWEQQALLLYWFYCGCLPQSLFSPLFF